MHATLRVDLLIGEALTVRGKVCCDKRLRYLGDDVGGDVLDALTRAACCWAQVGPQQHWPPPRRWSPDD
nr:hypothetical protein [uncultured Ralstonia sp.]